jgi:hypothetical protein
MPNTGKLLEGRRIVMASMPFLQVASPTGTLHSIGGGGLTDVSGRLVAQVRWAGLINYA